MLKQRVYQNRADRVIAIGRVALAGFSTVAVLVDPPTRSAPYVTPVIAIYLGLAAIFALVVWRRSAAALPLGTYAIVSDVMVFTALVYTSANGSSPFFPMLLFIILSATLKWQWRGALYVGAIVVVLFLPTGLSLPYFGPSAEDQTMRFVMRTGNLIVLSGLLIFFGAQRERVWEELLQLSKPLDSNAPSDELPVEACLSHAAAFFKAKRVLMVWETFEEPGALAALWQDGTVEHARVPDGLRPLVDAEIGDNVFLFGTDGEPARLYNGRGGFSHASGRPLSDAVREQWNLASGIAAPFRCETLHGWLIIEGATRDEDLYLARAVAGQIAMAIDKWASERAWREAAAGQERVRLARDLHDGILQFLAGLALQLRIVERDADRDPSAIPARIEKLQASLLTEQRDLRGFVQEMATPTPQETDPATDLRRLARLLAYHWDVEVIADLDDGFDPGGHAADLRQMVREGVANAVRHGGASRIDILGRNDQNSIRLEVRDNGRGLPVHGRAEITSSSWSGVGPRSLRARVKSLGGTMIADSKSKGLTLIIQLPPRQEEAAA